MPQNLSSWPWYILPLGTLVSEGWCNNGAHDRISFATEHLRRIFLVLEAYIYVQLQFSYISLRSVVHTFSVWNISLIFEWILQEEEDQGQATIEYYSRLEEAMRDAKSSKRKEVEEAVKRWKEEDNAVEARCKANFISPFTYFFGGVSFAFSQLYFSKLIKICA